MAKQFGCKQERLYRNIELPGVLLSKSLFDGPWAGEHNFLKGGITKPTARCCLVVLSFPAPAASYPSLRYSVSLS